MFKKRSSFYSLSDNRDNNGNYNGKSYVKASVTIEMSVIMPVVMMLICFVISVGLYEYNISVISRESILSARDSSFRNETKLPTNSMCLGAEAVHYEADEKKGTKICRGKASIKILMFANKFNIDICHYYTGCCGPEYIRKATIVMNIKNGLVNKDK